MTEDAAFGALLAAVARRIDAAEQLEALPADDLLTAIAASAVVALDAQAASIAILDSTGSTLTFRAAAGPAAGSVVGLSIDAAAGIAGYAVTSGQPLAVADAPSDPRFDRTVAEATGYVPSSILATPLTDDEGTVGVLEALDRRGGSFTLRDLDVATAIAREATLVVRAGAMQRDTSAILRGSLQALLGEPEPGPDVTADDVHATADRLVSEAVAAAAGDRDDGAWALADRLARLRDVDPGSTQLAVEWLDALLRHTGPRRTAGR